MESGLPSFIPGFTCPALLRIQHAAHLDSHTQLSCALAVLPITFWFPVSLTCGFVCHRLLSFNPVTRNARRLDTSTVWASPDSLATTTGILSLPQGTLDVSVPLVPSAFAVAFRLGCPIRRSRDHYLLAIPPSFSQRCHVLLRHTTPRHPPYAHSVFPVGTSAPCLDQVSLGLFCLLVNDYPVKVLHLHAAPSPLNRDDSPPKPSACLLSCVCGFRGAHLAMALAP